MMCLSLEVGNCVMLCYAMLGYLVTSNNITLADEVIDGTRASVLSTVVLLLLLPALPAVCAQSHEVTRDPGARQL